MAGRPAIKRTVVYCVDCGETIALSGRVETGQIVTCPDCGAAMQVVSLTPVAVDWVDGEPELVDQEEY